MTDRGQEGGFRQVLRSRPKKVVHTALNDGTRVCIREIEPDDEQRMRDGIARMSPRSMYLRFFTGQRSPPDRVIAQLLDSDGHRHLAWGAIDEDASGGPAVGAVHAYRDPDHPDCAEFSVAVIDAYHGRGLGKLMTATLLLDARAQGIDEFRALTLAENAPAIEFVRSLGGYRAGGEGATIEFHLPVSAALDIMRSECEPPGMRAVFAAFAPSQKPRSGKRPAP